MTGQNRVTGWQRTGTAARIASPASRNRDRPTANAPNGPEAHSPRGNRHHAPQPRAFTGRRAPGFPAQRRQP